MRTEYKSPSRTVISLRPFPRNVCQSHGNTFIYIGCSFFRIIRCPHHLINRHWYLPGNRRSLIWWSPDQWVSQCYAIEYDRRFYCALFCVFMTRVSQCPISLRAGHQIQAYSLLRNALLANRFLVMDCSVTVLYLWILSPQFYAIYLRNVKELAENIDAETKNYALFFTITLCGRKQSQQAVCSTTWQGQASTTDWDVWPHNGLELHKKWKLFVLSIFEHVS
jgi:hypothetical protein